MLMGDVEEFDCSGCGCHVVRWFSGPPTCLHCTFMPGWQDDPELRRIFGEPTKGEGDDNDVAR